MKDQIFLEKLFSAEALAAGNNTESGIVHFYKNGEKAGRIGNLALWLKVTGTGTVKVEALVNGDDDDASSDWHTLTTAIIETATGVSLTAFEVPICTKMKLKVTEDGGVNPVTFDLNVVSR